MVSTWESPFGIAAQTFDRPGKSVRVKLLARLTASDRLDCRVGMAVMRPSEDHRDAITP
jgi:hypothetical protein